MVLLNEGANREAQDKDRESVLMKAAYSGKKEVVALLLDKGANRDTQDNEGKTAADHAQSGAIRDMITNRPVAKAFLQLKNNNNSYTSLLSGEIQREIAAYTQGSNCFASQK